jgi:DNA-binding MarR family transcriptional regulator
VTRAPQAGVSVSEYRRTADFRAALRRFFRVSEDAARRHHLTPRRHLLLLMIKGASDGSESSTVSELSERMQLAHSTISELVQRAEVAGLLRRDSSNEDGRVMHLRLTPAGEAALGRVHADLAPERAELARLLGLISDSD